MLKKFIVDCLGDFLTKNHRSIPKRIPAKITGAITEGMAIEILERIKKISGFPGGICGENLVEIIRGFPTTKNK